MPPTRFALVSLEWRSNILGFYTKGARVKGKNRTCFFRTTTDCNTNILHLPYASNWICTNELKSYLSLAGWPITTLAYWQRRQHESNMHTLRKLGSSQPDYHCPMTARINRESDPRLTRDSRLYYHYTINPKTPKEFESSTSCLQDRCSTFELQRHSRTQNRTGICLV